MRLPSFRYEREIWKKGYKIVAGVDEVGRGCFAGPVVASAVVFAPMINAKWPMLNEPEIDDCKRMTPKQRERADEWIRQNALAWGIGETPVSIINRLGMAKATRMAFRRAIAVVNLKLNAKSLKQIDFLLVDAFFVPYVPGLPTKRRKDSNGRFRNNPKGKQLAIIDGDQKSVSIAAASIIAKVYRDRLMLSFSKKKYRTEYDQPVAGKKYGWGRNKGYGTKEHQEAIKKYGMTRQHRKAFVTTFLSRYKEKSVNLG